MLYPAELRAPAPPIAGGRARAKRIGRGQAVSSSTALTEAGGEGQGAGPAGGARRWGVRAGVGGRGFSVGVKASGRVSLAARRRSAGAISRTRPAVMRR